MGTVQRFEELEIWKLAFDLYKKVSILASKIKSNHEFRFADQIKSAAGSVMDNIAEGFGRNSRLEFVKLFRHIKRGMCRVAVLKETSTLGHNHPNPKP